MSPLKMARQKFGFDHLHAGHIEAGETDFLLLAPEPFANAETLERLKNAKPALFVIDEAHCVSQWATIFGPIICVSKP